MVIGMTEISIGIVTYNNEETIERTLDALFRFCPEEIPCRVYVIDNGSTDQTLTKLANYQDDITMIRSDKGNVGFGAAHNLVLGQLDSTIHIIMNPDITLEDASTIPILYRYLIEHPDVGMVVPRILDENGALQYLCRRQPTVLDLVIRFLPGHGFQKRKNYHTMKDMDYDRSFEVEFASGCFMVIRTSLIRQLGGFDEKYFLYVEDADLTRRVNQTAKTVYVPESVVRHVWQRASYKNPAVTRIHLKSLWHYFRKWGLRYK